MDITILLLALVCIAAGFAIGFFISKSNITRLEERSGNFEKLNEELQDKLDKESARASHAENELATLKANYSNLKERLSEQQKELKEMQDHFRSEFKNLANDILEEKSKKFTEQNREKLDQILKPLGEKITDFQKRVEENHKEDLKDRSSLGQHLKTLQELNHKMSEEAKNLTKALKGDSKQQGNWGEVILQRILEKSGLVKDREYFTQESTTTEDGRRLQPDVIVRLPDEKILIIDSKVSLKDYEKYISSDDTSEQEKALKRHINSIRAHVKGLQSKNYEKIHGKKSPDFVLLFIPIESAFGLAMQNQPDLYNEAFERNIIIVSPTTLLATLATIDNVWKQEYQNENAMEIAARGGALYDKFVLFVESMEDVGYRIQQTQKSYNEAMGRLSEGAGNLVRQSEMLRELGANTSKKLPDNLTRNNEDSKIIRKEKEQEN